MRRTRLVAARDCSWRWSAAWPCRPGPAWEPTKPIEFVVPAGTGGGADQMARLDRGHRREAQALAASPSSSSTRRAARAPRASSTSRARRATPHTIIITLSNLFTTPLHTGVPFNWKDLTPVARLALDQFILWVNAETPYKTAKDYIAAVKERAGRRNR